MLPVAENEREKRRVGSTTACVSGWRHVCAPTDSQELGLSARTLEEGALTNAGWLSSGEPANDYTPAIHSREMCLSAPGD